MAPGCGMNVAAIPLELRELPRWVVWRWGADPKTGKPQKPPYCPGDPRQQRQQPNPPTGRPFEKAVSVVEAGKADGIGFVLEPPYVGVDLDDELPRGRPGARSCSRSTRYSETIRRPAPATTLS